MINNKKMKKGQVSHENIVIAVLIFVLLISFYSRTIFKSEGPLQEGVATIEALHIRNALRSVANLGEGSSYSTLIRTPIRFENNQIIIESNEVTIVDVPAGLTMPDAAVDIGYVTIANTGSSVIAFNNPIITSIVPSKIGRIGETFYINGNHFSNDLVLYFNGATIPSEFIDEHTVRFNVPNRAAGTYLLYLAKEVGHTKITSNTITFEISK